jgi:hypothetical protein
MAQYNRNNWHHIPGIGGIMATGLSRICIRRSEDDIYTSGSRDIQRE